MDEKLDASGSLCNAGRERSWFMAFWPASLARDREGCCMTLQGGRWGWKRVCTQTAPSPEGGWACLHTLSENWEMLMGLHDPQIGQLSAERLPEDLSSGKKMRCKWYMNELEVVLTSRVRGWPAEKHHSLSFPDRHRTPLVGFEVFQVLKKQERKDRTKHYIYDK